MPESELNVLRLYIKCNQLFRFSCRISGKSNASVFCVVELHIVSKCFRIYYSAVTKIIFRLFFKPEMEFLAVVMLAFLLSAHGGPVLQSQQLLQSEPEEPQDPFAVPQLSIDTDADSIGAADFEVPSCSPLGVSCSHPNSVSASPSARGLSAADEQRHHELQELLREMDNRSTPLTPDEQHLLKRQYDQLLRESLNLEVKALLDKCAHSVLVLVQYTVTCTPCSLV